ncbi:CPBP family intramembrane glutamic endopeptidase [Secundilactobacillus folii]|nr:type II CAAX endopeptidase family protein [Secundilactobacillus folii]
MTSKYPLKIDLVKSVVAILLLPIEMGLIAILIHSGQTKWTQSLIYVGLGLIVFLMTMYLYRDVLRRDWPAYRKHWLRNTLLNLCGVLVLFSVIALVRLVMANVLHIAAMTKPSALLSVQAAGAVAFNSIVVLLSPFTEEIVFRHVLFYQFKGRHAALTLAMLLISSVAFGLMHWNNFHGQVIQMVPYMFAGGVLALIYYYTNNIWQNIMTHFWLDFVQFAAAIALLVIAFFQ